MVPLERSSDQTIADFRPNLDVSQIGIRAQHWVSQTLIRSFVKEWWQYRNVRFPPKADTRLALFDRDFDQLANFFSRQIGCYTNKGLCGRGKNKLWNAGRVSTSFDTLFPDAQRSSHRLDSVLPTFFNSE
jgi:hypothetical protein